MSSSSIFHVIVLSFFFLLNGAVSQINYGDALTQSLLFYEAQRSGKLPPNQRVTWRGDSGLQDGSDASVDLVGGYYDAGDNVKFGFPMAFTITMLSWSVIEFNAKLKARNELTNALDAIRWGTDYFMKAHPSPSVLYGEVGDADTDHACWQRPEDMTTPRTSYKIDEQHPGADLAAETAAALAAASIAFAPTDAPYAAQLIKHARQLFFFARKHHGLYHDSIPVAGQAYKSSGFEDELLWGATWLYGATKDPFYRDYIGVPEITGGIRPSFSWDDKFLGVQVLIAKFVIDGTLEGTEKFSQYRDLAEQFICSCLQKGPDESNLKKTPGGLLWFLPWANLQYVTTASFVVAAYAEYLKPNNFTIECNGDVSIAEVADLIALAKSQADYILGSNPNNISYMVGFGANYPTKAHHRASSIVSIKKDPTPVGCQEGYDRWYKSNAANLNLLNGAIVGGPNEDDAYTDERTNYQQSEPATVIPAPFVGVLASLA